MKIEIDLNDILGDEFGAETLEESVRRQVVQQVSDTIRNGIGKTIDLEVSKLINDELSKAIAAKMPLLIDDLLNTEYVQVDTWGDRKRDPTTLRKELLRTITEQMTYKRNSSYKSDRDNIFTRAVDDIVSDNIKIFQKEYNTKVNELFVADALKYAIDKLKETLKIT